MSTAAFARLITMGQFYSKIVVQIADAAAYFANCRQWGIKKNASVAVTCEGAFLTATIRLRLSKRLKFDVRYNCL